MRILQAFIFCNLAKMYFLHIGFQGMQFYIVYI